VQHKGRIVKKGGVMFFIKPKVTFFSESESVETGKKVYEFTICFLWFKWIQCGRWKKAYPFLPEAQGDHIEETELVKA
jgi:hypothetical protein